MDEYKSHCATGRAPDTHDGGELDQIDTELAVIREEFASSIMHLEQACMRIGLHQSEMAEAKNTGHSELLKGVAPSLDNALLRLKTRTREFRTQAVILSELAQRIGSLA